MLDTFNLWCTCLMSYSTFRYCWCFASCFNRVTTSRNMLILFLKSEASQDHHSSRPCRGGQKIYFLWFFYSIKIQFLNLSIYLTFHIQLCQSWSEDQSFFFSNLKWWLEKRRNLLLFSACEWKEDRAIDGDWIFIINHWGINRNACWSHWSQSRNQM